MKRISGFQKAENTKDGANPTLVNDLIDNTAYDIIKRVYDELPQIQEYFPNMAELREILAQTANNAQKAYQWAENPPNDEVEPGNYSAKHWAILAQDRVNEIHNLSISISLVDPTYPATSTYDSSTGTLRISIPKGVGIQSISRISGENLPGTKDTYQITYTDNSNSTFEVYNGQDGVSITDITKVNGDGSPGSIDTYRINKSDGTYSSINVYNGKDGVSVLSFSKLSGTGEPGTDDVYRLTLSDGSYTDITIHQGRDTTGDMEKSVYDTNNNGIVDKAEDALKLNGQTGDYYGKQSDVDALNTSVNTLFTNKEDKSNKVTTFQPTPDNEHYPSEKLVKDQLDTKSDKGHTHTEADITDLDKYTKSEVDSKLATKANTTDVYTQTEIDDKLALKANASSIYSRATIDDKLATKIDLTEKGSANGVATLDENAKVPASQLPSFVDDVLEVDTLPSTGETGKLYVLTTTNQVFRWSGSSFIEISVGTGTADAAVKLAASRNIAIAGDATGFTSFDGTSDVTINLTVANSDKLDGMQPNELPISDATQVALDNKANKTLDNVADSDVLNKVKAVDGSGSLLDADLLDGKELSEIETNNLVMTKAEFEALAETRRKMFAGSGFVEFGNTRYYNDDSFVNEGMYTGRAEYNSANLLFLGNYLGAPIINVNGVSIKLLQYLETTNYPSFYIKLPQLPTSVAHITDSTNLPVGIKQGDFAILDDLNRELVTNGTFDNGIDGWNTIFGTLEYDSTNNRLKVISEESVWGNARQTINVIKNARYKLSISIYNGDVDAAVRIFDSYGKLLLDKTHIQTGNYTFEFVATASQIRIELRPTNSGTSYCFFDNISIKQVEEQPIVAVQDVSAGIDIYANVSKFEARDSISRQDLVFLESWYEKIADKDVVYPFGNTQYRGGDVDGLTGIIDANWFTGYDTYSLFGNWQNVGELVGKGYRWSQLSENQKRKLANNPEPNIFIDENGNWVQVRYRIRVVNGLGNTWDFKSVTDSARLAYNPVYGTYRVAVKAWGINPLVSNNKGDYTGVDTGSYSLRSSDSSYYTSYNSFKDRVFAIPIALVQRRNQGAYHPVYNPEGSAKFLNTDGTTAAYWYETDRTITSLVDCFAYATGGSISSGISGRPDGLYVDEVNERDVEDLRMDAKVYPYEEARNTWLNKAISDKVRGKERWYANFFTVTSPTEYYAYEPTFGLNKFKLYGLGDKHIEQGDIVILYSVNSNKYLNRGVVYNVLSDGSIYVATEKPHNLTSYGSKTSLPDDIRILFKAKNKTYTYNSTLTHCDIIGDPRKLDDRVKYTVDTSVSQTVDLQRGDYIKVTSDSGSTYTYYVSLVARTGIDLSTEDYTNTSNWVNLGTDGNQGGYPDEWWNKGIAGTPRIVNDDGSSLLPINAEYYGNAYLRIKLSKKNIKSPYALKVLASKKDGSFTEYSFGSAWETQKYYVESVNSIVQINVRDSYQDLGYSSQEEMLALMKVLIFYETKVNFLELADNREFLSIDDGIDVLGNFGINQSALQQNLINKVGASSWSGIWRTSFIKRGFKTNILSTYDGAHSYTPSHNPLDLPQEINSRVKYFTYLTSQNNRAYLQFVFKELKYDTTSGTWGDDNKFQITNKVSTRTDLNGQTVLYGQKRLPLNIFIKED